MARSESAGQRAKGWASSPVVRLLLVGAAYYATAWLSLRIALVGGVVTPIWPPTGIAFVAVLWFGYGVWPAIAVTALLVNVTINDSLASVALIAVGNTIAPMFAVALVRLAGFRSELDRLRDALAVVGLGALVAMTVSASFGTAALLVDGTIKGGAIASTWSVWWAGDATGILVFAPLLLSIRRPDWVRLRQWLHVVEGIALLAALSVVADVVFRSKFEDAYLVFPFLIWASIRFGQFGASVATLVIVSIAVSAAVDEVGPFAHTTLLHRMLTLQVYNAVATLTSFVLAAITTERAKALEGVKSALVREHAITETLQRSLLPDRLPDLAGVALAGRYLPGAVGVEVGGDWYDVFALPDGRIGLTIGDVVGHGLGAAAAMGQLRTALRAYALEQVSPSTVIDRLSRLVQEFEAAQMATLIYAVLDPGDGTLVFASAGHPPPLLISSDGTSRYLEGGRCPPLGVTRQATSEAAVTIEPGSTLLLYTDGLVESRRCSIGEGMDRLRAVVAGFEGDLDALCDDRVLRVPRPEGGDDDVALLAVSLLAVPADELRLVLPAEPHVLAQVRRVVGQWLTRLGADEDETYDVVLACDESVANVVQHAYGALGGDVEMEATRHGAEVSITVRDHGRWRMPRGGDGGRGLTLMRALMDDVEITRTTEGTVVSLRRTLGRPEVRPRAAPAAESPERTAAAGAARPSSETIAVVRLSGDIDLVNAPTLYERILADERNDALGLVVDLTEVRHVDSSGIRMLFQIAARLAPRRQQMRVIVPPDSPLRRVLTIADVARYVVVAPTAAQGEAEIRAVTAAS